MGRKRIFVEYGADTKIESHTEIQKVVNKYSKRPRGKNMRALLTCPGGTLVFESEEYAVSVVGRKKAKHLAPVTIVVSRPPVLILTKIQTKFWRI